MKLFSKKQTVDLEDFLPVVVQTAFKYPTETNLKRVDANRALSATDIKRVQKETPIFMVAVNAMLLMLSGLEGKVPRYKGDSPEEISEYVSYGMTVTIGRYFEAHGATKDQAADRAEALMSKVLAYVKYAEDNLKGQGSRDDIFFHFCQRFRLQTLGDDDTYLDQGIVVFDFAKQLYRNIRSAYDDVRVQ